jgi:hypothetical protein
MGGARGSRTPLSQPASAHVRRQLQAHHRNAEKVEFVRSPISSELKKSARQATTPFSTEWRPSMVE